MPTYDSASDALRERLLLESDAFRRDVLMSLPQLTLVLGALFLASGAGRIVFQREGASTAVVAIAMAAAFVNIAVAVALRRLPLPLEWAHPVLFADGVVVLIQALALFYTTADPLEVSSIAFLIIGAGFFLHLFGWWLALVGLCVVGWLVVASLVPDPAWLYLLSIMAISLVISAAAYIQRVGALRQAVRLRMADLEQRAQLQKAMGVASRSQGALRTSVEVAQRISSILDIEPLLTQVVQRIQEYYGYDRIAVYLLPSAGTHLVQRASIGQMGDGTHGAVETLAVDEDMPVAVAARERRVVRVDLGAAGAELALPLEAGGELVGVLDIGARRGELATGEDMAVLELLAGQIAVALKNAMRYQAERTARLFAEKLVDVGYALSRVLNLDTVLNLILRQVAEIVPHDRGSIMLQSDEGTSIMVVASRGFPENTPTAGVRVSLKPDDVYCTIRDTQRPLAIAEVRRRGDWEYVEDIPPARSWLGVPLILQGQVIGMLSLTREQPSPYTDDETTLALAFANQASVALVNARLYDSISHMNERLARTIDELEQRTEDLRVTYQQLERLDRTKSDFINVAAHELRTPLTVLSGYSQMLLQDPIVSANPYYRQLVSGMEAGTARLHKIVDSMIDMARINSRALQLHPEPLFPGVLIRAIRSTLRDVFTHRNITVTADPTLDALPLVEVDTASVRKVFYHLMVNAIKYTPDGGQVTIHGRHIRSGHPDFPEGGIEIIVSDTGIGIDKDVQELIFRFFQTGKVASHSSGIAQFKGGGPGLGLAIARGIVEAHGGRIWASSPGYDELACPGSDFHVILPLTSRALLEEAPDGYSAPADES